MVQRTEKNDENYTKCLDSSKLKARSGSVHAINTYGGNGGILPFIHFGNKEFLCITRTVKHNYIILISTVRIQLHVSVLYVDHLQVEIFNLQISYTRCMGHLCGPRGGGRDLVVSVVGTVTSSC